MFLAMEHESLQGDIPSVNTVHLLPFYISLWSLGTLFEAKAFSVCVQHRVEPKQDNDWRRESLQALHPLIDTFQIHKYGINIL